MFAMILFTECIIFFQIQGADKELVSNTSQLCNLLLHLDYLFMSTSVSETNKQNRKIITSKYEKNNNVYCKQKRLHIL